ncbi:MAG: uracil-DNA glycosylase family protein [Ginsengibacter sp.]
MKTFAEKIISFNKKVAFKGSLPKGISIMNPFKENPEALKISSQFYKTFYNDHHQRHIILGINPGRFGAGVTGVPFTDTKRLINECGLEFSGKPTHEPSATFIYEMINAYGGTKKFYQDFYIQSIFPLGFTATNEKGKEVNYNYYDSKELTEAVYNAMIKNIKTQVSFGISTDLCFCFGTGKNEKYLNKINDKYQFFKRVIALEHPRFIMQYKFKTKELYIDKYLNAFNEIK